MLWQPWGEAGYFAIARQTVRIRGNILLLPEHVLHLNNPHAPGSPETVPGTGMTCIEKAIGSFPTGHRWKRCGFFLFSFVYICVLTVL